MRMASLTFSCLAEDCGYVVVALDVRLRGEVEVTSVCL